MQERTRIVAENILKKRVQIETVTRYVSTALSVVAFIFALHLAVNENYIGAGVCGGLSIIFIAIAAGYSRLELAFEKARAKLSISR